MRKIYFVSVDLAGLFVFLFALFIIYFKTKSNDRSGRFQAFFWLCVILSILLQIYPELVSPFGYPIESSSIAATTPQEYFERKGNLERPLAILVTFTMIAFVVAQFVFAVVQSNTHLLVRIFFLIFGVALALLLWMDTMMKTMIAWPE